MILVASCNLDWKHEGYFSDTFSHWFMFCQIEFCHLLIFVLPFFGGCSQYLRVSSNRYLVLFRGVPRLVCFCCWEEGGSLLKIHGRLKGDPWKAQRESFPFSSTLFSSLRFVHLMCWIIFWLVQVVGNEGAQLSPTKVHRTNQMWRGDIFANIGWDTCNINKKQHVRDVCLLFFSSNVLSTEYNHWTGEARLKSRACF